MGQRLCCRGKGYVVGARAGVMLQGQGRERCAVGGDVKGERCASRCLRVVLSDCFEGGHGGCTSRARRMKRSMRGRAEIARAVQGNFDERRKALEKELFVPNWSVTT